MAHRTPLQLGGGGRGYAQPELTPLFSTSKSSRQGYSKQHNMWVCAVLALVVWQ